MLTNGLVSHFGRRLASSITAAFCLSGALWAMYGMAAAQETAEGKTPMLMQSDVGWISAGGFLDPPAGMRGPIRQHPAHPFHGNLDGPGQVTPAIGNWEDPVLKPWAAAHMKMTNDEVLSGERSLAFTAQSRCHPRRAWSAALPDRADVFPANAPTGVDDLAA